MTSVSSTSSGSASTTSSIDVASIVSQLMTVASKPLNDIKSQETNVTTLISDVGTLKSKLVTFQNALTSLESPATYNSAQATSSNENVATAEVSNGAPLGRYNLLVNQTAESSNISIQGISSPNQLINLNDPVLVADTSSVYDNLVLTQGQSSATLSNLITSNASVGSYTFSSSISGPDQLLTLSKAGVSQTVTLSDLSSSGTQEKVNFNQMGVSFTLTSDSSIGESANQIAHSLNGKDFNIIEGFSIKIGQQTFNTGSTYGPNTNPATTGGTISPLGTNPTVSDLSNWINALNNNFNNANLKSSLVQTSNNSYAMVISGQPGLNNAISFSGFNGGSVTSSLGVSDSNVSVINGSANGNSFPITVNTSARDALFSLNGLNFQRSSNSISDIYSGITFNLSNPVSPSVPSSGSLTLGEQIFGSSGTATVENLNSSQATAGSYSFTSSGDLLTLSNGHISQTITLSSLSSLKNSEVVNFDQLGVNFTLKETSSQGESASDLASSLGALSFNINPTSGNNTLINVSHGADNSQSTINSFISAYNDLINQYHTMVANPVSTSSTTASTGSLGNDPQMLSFIQNIQHMVAQGALTQSNQPVSLANIGIDYQTDGTLSFNQVNFSSAQSNGLLSLLSGGLNVGGVIGSTINLDSVVSSALDPGGTLYEITQTENQSLNQLQIKASNLTSQLAVEQNAYTNQYSTLNTLLYNLSQTSAQLTSSLAAVTNINAQH
jgi:flagellar hook-associated protein 2